ncbi:hypothetical protein G6F68_015520 [Rhizopus microsporus]|nr:hypothetical protein G6F68_015520 [Rhizopus microsporus]
MDELQQFNIFASHRSATIVRNRKGKGHVEIDSERLIVEYEGIPGTAPSDPNLSHVNNYVRVLVDSFNLADTAMLY